MQLVEGRFFRDARDRLIEIPMLGFERLDLASYFFVEPFFRSFRQLAVDSVINSCPLSARELACKGMRRKCVMNEILKYAESAV